MKINIRTRNIKNKDHNEEEEEESSSSGRYINREVTYPNSKYEKQEKGNQNFNGCVDCFCPCLTDILINIKFLIYITSVCIVLFIPAIATSFQYTKPYKDLREEILDSDKYKDKNYKYIKFWCGIIPWDIAFLIVTPVVLILYLIYLIINIIFYKSIYILENKTGTIYKTILFIYYLFYIIFKILTTFNTFMFNYALVVTVICPSIAGLKYLSTVSSMESNAENDWLDQRLKSSFHVAILFLILIGMFCLLSSKKLIILLLDMKYEEDDINKYINVGRIKNTKMKIRGKDLDIDVKTNKSVYIKDSNDKIITFKQIFINNVTKEYIYIKIDNRSIEDQLSIADWDNPKVDYIVDILEYLCNTVYLLLSLSIITLVFYAKNEKGYETLKTDIQNKTIRIKLGAIYKVYGNFEYRFTLSRFIFYLVILIILFLIKIKRILSGGFSNYATLIMTYIFSILFTLINAVFLIINLILTIFSLLCILADYDIRKNEYYKGTFYDYFFLKYIFVIDLIINILITVDIIFILKNSFAFFEKINGIKNDYIKINKKPNGDGEKDAEDKSDKDGEKKYIYVGHDMEKYILSEYIIDGYPRYLLYVLNKVNRMKESKDDINFDINSKNNMKIKQNMDESY